LADGRVQELAALVEHRLLDDLICPGVEVCAFERRRLHGLTVGPMYDVAATTLSYHFRVSAIGLLRMCSDRLKRSMDSDGGSRRRRFLRWGMSLRGSDSAMRPSRLPGVLARSMTS